VPGVSEIRETKVSVFIFFFCINKKIVSNLQAGPLIQLKFGTLVGCIQANLGTNIGENTAKVHEDTSVHKE